jgi:hypothetical protein
MFKTFVASALFAVVGASAFAQNRHPASRFVLNTMNEGQRILENKSEEERVNGLCGLLKANVLSAHIANSWLGDYAELRRERSAVQRFRAMIPSILMTKGVGAIGGGDAEGSFVVDPEAQDRGNDIFAVNVTITVNGRRYNGKAIVWKNGANYKLIDGEYMGFSAVEYQGREYQGFLNREYNKDPERSMPVTALIRDIQSEEGYINCR